MYEKAHALPWLFCVDKILNTISTHISLLRTQNKNNTGLVPVGAATIEKRWDECARIDVFELEEGVDK
jgi:SWIM zinc finger